MDLRRYRGCRASLRQRLQRYEQLKKLNDEGSSALKVKEKELEKFVSLRMS